MHYFLNQSHLKIVPMLNLLILSKFGRKNQNVAKQIESQNIIFVISSVIFSE